MNMQNYTTPFAATGDREEFSINADPSGKVSLEKGFTELYQLKPEEGGLFILRRVFNQMMKLVSTDTVTWKIQTFPNWIDDKGDGLPFAYPKNAIVRATDGENYISLENNNTENPVGSTKWKNSNVENIVNHNDLTGRSDNDCHPISAITGLQSIIDSLGTSGITLSDFTGSNQSLSRSGYQKLPGGLIIQWGSTTNTANVQSITWPIAFPNAFLVATTAEVLYATSSSHTVFSEETTTGATLERTNGAGKASWIVIGY